MPTNTVYLKNSMELLRFRSSRPEAFCKKGVLTNFTKFTGKETLAQKFLRTPFYIEHLSLLLLEILQTPSEKVYLSIIALVSLK